MSSAITVNQEDWESFNKNLKVQTKVSNFIKRYDYSRKKFIKLRNQKTLNIKDFVVYFHPHRFYAFVKVNDVTFKIFCPTIKDMDGFLDFIEGFLINKDVDGFTTATNFYSML